MLSSQALYLFKAARRPLYRKENLQLLAAERGSMADVWYNRGWVAPELWGEGRITPGTRVVFVFADRPYTVFVPMRQGEVLEAGMDELGLRLRVVVANWVGVPDNDLAAFTRAVKESNPGGVPGARFVAPKRDDVQLTAYYDAREDRGWENVVENILEASKLAPDDPYRRSVFFRPLGLRVGDELHVARRVPLEAGARATLLLGFHNPHLTEDDVAGLELRVLAPDDAVRVESPARFPLTGQLEVPFEVLGGEPALTVQVGPAPAEHTAVTMRFAVRAGQDGPGGVGALAGETAASPSPAKSGDAVAWRAEVLRLYDVVQRNASMQPAGELNVLDAFERLLPGDQRLAERRALLLAELGDTERAWHVLRTLDPELLGDDARLLLFRLHAARDGGAGLAAHVLSLDLLSESRFPRFVDALGELPPQTVAKLVPDLVRTLPAEQLRAVIDRAGRRLESPDALAETALNLYLVTDDAAWAYAFLDERRRALRLADRAVVEALLELAAAGGRAGDGDDLGDEAARVIGNLIELDRIEEARAQLTRACRALRRGEREQLYHRVADRLIRKRQHEAAAEALVELSREALRTGDLAEASEAVERAVGVWMARGLDGAAQRAGARVGARDGGGAVGSRGATSARSAAVARGAGNRAAAELPAWLAEAVDAVRVAWEKCEPLVEWRKDEEQRRSEALRAQYAGKRILIAGGLRRQEWVDRLRELTGAEVDWAERYRDEGDDLSRFAERIRAGTYACVVYFYRKSGHEVQDRLKQACEEAGVPFRPAASAGWRGVVEGLASFA